MTKLLNTLTIAILFVTICYSLAFCQETLTITTYYPSPYGSYRDIQVADSLIYTTTQTGDDVRIHSIVQGGGTWLVIQGGANAADNIWIGGDGTPDDTTGTITLSADRVIISGSLNASTCVGYTGGASQNCPAGHYAVACGSGNCNNPGLLANPTNCPLDGYMICVKHAD